MKTRSFQTLAATVSAAALLATAAACLQPQPPTKPAESHMPRAPGDDPYTTRDAELVAINNALDDFHDAASKSDFDRYFSHWTPASVFLGTDATERWVGQEFKDFAKPYFDAGKGWTYRPHDRHITLGSDDDRAFFDELLNNDKLGVCRGSGVLKKYHGSWKILQYNLSIMVPNDKADRIAALIRAESPPPPATDGKHKE